MTAGAHIPPPTPAELRSRITWWFAARRRVRFTEQPGYRQCVRRLVAQLRALEEGVKL